jgi:hypothetical protein
MAPRKITDFMEINLNPWHKRNEFHGKEIEMMVETLSLKS